LREIIKSELNDYMVAVSSPNLEHRHYKFGGKLWAEILEDRLLALFPPEPDRERLIDLLDKCFPEAEDIAPVSNAVMAWATGERGKRSWCEHVEERGSKESGDNRLLLSHDGYYTTILDHWNLCPICGKARP